MKLSTRSGEFITMKEMIDELSVGVVRYFFAMRSPDTQMTFDWDLAKDTSMDNPVYYVQYAPRCCSCCARARNGSAVPGHGGMRTESVAACDEKAIVRLSGVPRWWMPPPRNWRALVPNTHDVAQLFTTSSRWATAIVAAHHPADQRVTGALR
jgi:hypothetical protein